MENNDYSCRNGAYHTEMCCATCWNGHPFAISGQFFLGTKEQVSIEKNNWINNAIAVNFTRKQAEFLYKILI